MAWRFKASKYKNAAPIVPKPENCIRDITVGSYQTYGHNIAASAAFMAFNVGQTGASLGVLPLEDVGRKGKDMALLHGHSDTVTDMSFSPFHDGLLATGSQDCSIKVWCIPEGGLENSLTEPECVLHSKTQRRVETVLFHPVADCLLATSSWSVLNLWDITAQQCIYSNLDAHSEVIQCLSWNASGTLLATTCKDKLLRILDPRADSSLVNSTNSHQGIKDSRVVWLNDNQRLLTTGFNATRQREIVIRDSRKLNIPVKSVELDSSSGILLPLYDTDTGMCFLAGKGDTSIQYMEVTDREPYLVEGLRHTGEQTKGAALVAKRALHVMQGEVNRVLQLTSSMVIPIMYQVPRKTYRDFHADLYPDTNGCVSDVCAAEWMTGVNGSIHKISLDPAKNSPQSLVSHRGSLQQLAMELDVRTRAKPAKSDPIRVARTRKIESDTNGENKEPPKPRPRNVRSNSVELVEDRANIRTNYTEDNNCSNVIEEERPIAKPRTTRLDSDHDSESRPWMRRANTEYIGDGGEENRPVFRRANTCIQPEPDMRESEMDGKPLLKRSNTDMNEESKMRADMMESEKDQGGRGRTIIQSVNPNLPVSGGYKPRLGPKPFTPPRLSGFAEKGVIETNLDTDLDKPAFASDNNELSNASKQNKDYEKNPLQIHSFNNVSKIDNDLEKPLKKVLNSDEVVVRNGDNNHVSKMTNIPEKTVTKSPIMMERKSVIEDKTDAPEESSDGDSLERGAPLRASIAERRRLYENRSVSVQDDKTSPTPLRRKGSLKGKEEPIPEPTPAAKRTSTVFGRVSKFRHLKGTPMHKSTHIENIRNVSRQVSGECDGFHGNSHRVAVPLSGPGGKIAVLELAKTGRLADGVMPALVNGASVMDFCWDPFDPCRLAVSCDDGLVRLWKIPSGGLTEPSNEPSTVLECHADKIYCIKFHPLAQDVLATAAYDMTVKIWDLDALKLSYTLTGHKDQVLCMAWSPCGRKLATVCKDGALRVYNPRSGVAPEKQGKGPAGTRGARLVWALEGAYIVVMGFDKVSERQIIVYDSNHLQIVNSVGLDVSPAILIPFYDEDSSTLFLTGRGDTTIYTFEVSEEAPFVCPLSHHRCSTLHQGLAFLPKNVCDVASVEFARALRLTNNTIEPLSFTVPRVKSELFQDDLFPATKVTWEPTMTCKDWVSGANKQSKRVSLKPSGMESLTALSTAIAMEKEKTAQKNNQAPSLAAMQSAYSKNSPELFDYSKNKQEQLKSAVSSRLEMNLSLEQDKMEGVDEREWEE